MKYTVVQKQKFIINKSMSYLISDKTNNSHWYNYFKSIEICFDYIL